MPSDTSPIICLGATLTTKSACWPSISFMFWRSFFSPARMRRLWSPKSTVSRASLSEPSTSSTNSIVPTRMSIWSSVAKLICGFIGAAVMVSIELFSASITAFAGTCVNHRLVASALYRLYPMLMFKFITAGESHGKGLVAIIEGLPAGLTIDLSFINHELWRRQQGYGRGGRMKIEQDEVEILSGVRHGKTLGSPVALLVRNRDFENWLEVMNVEPRDFTEEK